MTYEPRKSFAQRLDEMDAETKNYYKEVEKTFTENPGVKARTSLRCVTFRHQKDVLGKVALGGKTLKLYLAMDPNESMLKDGKYHPRDLSQTKAYELVPTMLPIKSEVALRKAKSAIQYVVLRKIFNF